METKEQTKIPKRRGMRGVTKIPLEGLIDYLKKPENAVTPAGDGILVPHEHPLCVGSVSINVKRSLTGKGTEFFLKKFVAK